MAMFVSLLFAFTACETTTKPDDKPEEDGINTENATEFTSMIIYDAGPAAAIFPSFNMFHFQGLTESATYNPETGDCTGSGFLVELNQAFSYAENSMPTCKNYTPFELTADNYIKEVFVGASGSLSIYEVSNGELDENNPLSTRQFKAQLVADGNTVKFVVEGNFDGEVHTFVFEGTPMVINLSDFWRDAKDEGAKFEGTENYAQAEVIYYGKTGVLPVNVIEVVLLSKDQTSFANFYCYGSLDNIENVYGTFNVSAEHTVGTMAKGPGLFVGEDGAYAYPSFVARNYSQNGADYYFVDGGSLTIEEGKISFDLTSLNGSKIKTNYVGNIAIKSYQEAYPNGAPKKAPAKKNIVKKQLFEVAPYSILF